MINVENWMPCQLSRALGLFASEDVWTASTAVRRLDTSLVLAHAWNQNRLARCREMLAQGREAPVIKVVGFRIGRQTLYTVSDGMHRTIAARELGQTIKAAIGGYYSVDLKSHTLFQGFLLRRETDRIVRHQLELTEELIVALRKLGVKDFGELP